ncbi:MAG: aminotransferase class I/II-fold pyridoxal phosphate-dependent enzyme [Phycisphaerales bacterium]|nr:aminotransferase class I/II-fold pyridoxal phosphate-dependent enzyme [Phycisphaerales bacterium]
MTSSPSPRSASVDPDLLCARAGLNAGDGEPLVGAIVQSTTFCRSDVDSTCTHQYSRVSNPTVSTLEDALGGLERALPAACFATGLAAETALFLALLKQGDHVVCGRSVYGGTTRLLRQVLCDFGVETTFVDATDIDDVAATLRPNTRLVFVETPANPTLDLTDLRAVADLTHAAGACLAVDNTFLTPVLQQPLDLGADVSIYSTTKFIEGHSTSLGGALVTRDDALLQRLRFIRKCTGAIQSPLNAWLTVQGLRTLPLRIRHQSVTATTVAAWLADQPAVRAVHHPSRLTGAPRDLAERQHLGAHGAVVTFDLRGGIDAARTFTAHLTLCRVVEHVGAIDTLITHPATMTHADVPIEQRRAVGITDGLLRLSAGLEPVDAIIADLDRALRAIRAEPTTQEARPCVATT